MSRKSFIRYGFTTLVAAACVFAASGVPAGELNDEQRGAAAPTDYESAHAACHPALAPCARHSQRSADDRGAMGYATAVAYDSNAQIDRESAQIACHPALGPCARQARTIKGSDSVK